MIILFDIDFTLLDSEHLRNTIQNNRLPALFGVSSRKINSLTDQYLSTLGSSIEFCPREYVQFLANKLDKAKEKAALDIFLNNPTDFRAALYSEVMPVLEELHKKHRLGIFSEGDAEFQKTKLEKSGIRKFFDDALVFIFPTKGDKLNYVWEKVKTYQCPVLIIDDSINHVTKISKTRLTPILIDRKRVAENTFASIRSLEELPQIMKMVGRLGLEPRTSGLKGRYSTIELATHSNRVKGRYSNQLS